MAILQYTECHSYCIRKHNHVVKKKKSRPIRNSYTLWNESIIHITQPCISDEVNWGFDALNTVESPSPGDLTRWTRLNHPPLSAWVSKARVKSWRELLTTRQSGSDWESLPSPFLRRWYPEREAGRDRDWGDFSGRYMYVRTSRRQRDLTQLLDTVDLGQNGWRGGGGGGGRLVEP